MARARRRFRPQVVADINVTSLVDVAFVLLIIFMIAAPMMQAGIEVRLPRTEARPLESREALVVTLDRSGRIHVDQSVMRYADFRSSFRALVARRRPEGIYLRADRGVPYGEVARVLAIIRTSGVANVGLVTEPEDVP